MILHKKRIATCCTRCEKMWLAYFSEFQFLFYSTLFSLLNVSLVNFMERFTVRNSAEYVRTKMVICNIMTGNVVTRYSCSLFTIGRVKLFTKKWRLKTTRKKTWSEYCVRYNMYNFLCVAKKNWMQWIKGHVSWAFAAHLHTHTQKNECEKSSYF